MDFQNRAGNKAGGGGNLSYSERNVDRRERLRLLALELSDINKDPYIIRNNVGSYECKLCFTIHNNEGDYLAHTQGKKHQTNIEKRKMKSYGDKNSENNVFPLKPSDKGTDKNLINNADYTIGRPYYKITKYSNPELKENSLLIELDYPLISPQITPKYRIINSNEQKVEIKDDNYQYIVLAAEPYENIAFKVPNKKMDFEEGKYYQKWNDDDKKYNLFFTFKS